MAVLHCIVVQLRMEMVRLTQSGRRRDRRRNGNHRPSIARPSAAPGASAAGGTVQQQDAGGAVAKRRLQNLQAAIEVAEQIEAEQTKKKNAVAADGADDTAGGMTMEMAGNGSAAAGGTAGRMDAAEDMTDTLLALLEDLAL